MTKSQSKKVVLKSIIRERTKWAKAVAEKKGWCPQVLEGPNGPIFYYHVSDLARRR
jgi:hypothetical protein